MNAASKQKLVAFVAGLMFAVGLGIAGMTNPAKVLAFLDIFGDWDPSLMFVMGGAILVYAPAHRLVLRRPTPLFDGGFHMPTRKDIDKRLILGAVMFGVGWGLAGLCPGPAVVATATATPELLAFAFAMVVGMDLQRRFTKPA